MHGRSFPFFCTTSPALLSPLLKLSLARSAFLFFVSLPIVGAVRRRALVDCSCITETRPSPSSRYRVPSPPSRVALSHALSYFPFSGSPFRYHPERVKRSFTLVSYSPGTPNPDSRLYPHTATTLQIPNLRRRPLDSRSKQLHLSPTTTNESRGSRSEYGKLDASSLDQDGDSKPLAGRAHGRPSQWR